MTVYVFKTSDGIELIGDVVIANENRAEDYEFYKVQDPLEIRYRESDYGASQAVLLKYNYFTDERTISLFRHSVVAMYRASDEYAKTYDESVKSIAEQTKTNRASSVKSGPDGALAAALKILTSNNTFH